MRIFSLPDADLDTMRAWFANAMEAMRSHIYQTKDVRNKK